MYTCPFMFLIKEISQVADKNYWWMNWQVRKELIIFASLHEHPPFSSLTLFAIAESWQRYTAHHNFVVLKILKFLTLDAISAETLGAVAKLHCLKPYTNIIHTPLGNSWMRERERESAVDTFTQTWRHGPRCSENVFVSIVASVYGQWKL